MSCYLRHLKDIFEEAGIQITSGNRKQIDRAVHEIVGTDYKDCPATWRRLKESLLSDELKRRGFIQNFKDALT